VAEEREKRIALEDLEIKSYWRLSEEGKKMFTSLASRPENFRAREILTLTEQENLWQLMAVRPLVCVVMHVKTSKQLPFGGLMFTHGFFEPAKKPSR